MCFLYLKFENIVASILLLNGLTGPIYSGSENLYETQYFFFDLRNSAWKSEF